jgi:hypothetical protein
VENPEQRTSVDPALRETARNAWTFGLLAIGLTVLIPCTSYLSILAALPLGLIALARARAVLDGERVMDEATEVYARTGRVLGLMASSVSGLFLVLVGTFLVLYLALIAMAFGVAASVPPPPPPVSAPMPVP